MDASAEPVAVVGAGLAGSLAALFLRERGENVVLVDLRDDPRAASAAAASAAGDTGLSLLANASKRSINLALSSRGLRALRKLGLAEAVLRDAVQMRGRMIHSPTGATELQLYGETDEEVLNSVSRDTINRFLLDRLAAEPAPGHGTVDVRFKHKVTALDKDGSLTVLDTAAPGGGASSTVRARLVIGADGSFSVIRREMSKLCRLSLRHEYIEHGYLELSIPPLADGATGEFGSGFALHPHALHIWPRHDFMLIALPNKDGSFTGTLFASWELLDRLAAAETGLAFFREHFPDALAVMPDLAAELAHNPRGALATVRCDPWHAAGRVLLIGDAAHAVVPFYGQGMNAAFEDCLVLDDVLTRAAGDLPSALQAFYAQRKPACDALAELSLGNYVEMCARGVRWASGETRAAICKRRAHACEVCAPTANTAAGRQVRGTRSHSPTSGRCGRAHLDPPFPLPSLVGRVCRRSKTASRLFVLKNAIHATLHRWMSGWEPSLHSAVSFSAMPYHVARARCEWQDTVLVSALKAAGAAAACAGAIAALRARSR
jgi:kynurenine 3-monooxygenase